MVPLIQLLAYGVVYGTYVSQMGRYILIYYFSYQPNVHNSKLWWLSIKKEVAKASGDPDRVQMDLESRGH